MSFKKTISILGSTGSIGSNTVDVINSDKKKFSVFSLSSKNNVNLLCKQALLLKPKIVAIQNKKKYKDLRNNLFGKKIKILAGDEGVIECTDNKVEIVVASIVGIAGLKPTLNSIENCSKLCLANKECLVSAGSFFMKKISKSKCKLLPLDSEHNAIRPKLIESYLSKSPPWPGNILPESFTWNFLLTLDINKSPNKPDIEINSGKKNIKYLFSKFK